MIGGMRRSANQREIEFIKWYGHNEQDVREFFKVTGIEGNVVDRSEILALSFCEPDIVSMDTRIYEDEGLVAPRFGAYTSCINSGDYVCKLGWEIWFMKKEAFFMYYKSTGCDGYPFNSKW